MRRLVLAAALVTAAALPAPAQVRIDIGIQLPGPPPLVVIPGAPVYYAPSAPANVFFYGGQYWIFGAGGWHVGPTWSGPWVIVAPVRVPVPILRVPVRYYPAPPGHWKTWRRDGPPRWEAHYGRDWREDDHERHWREREERWEHARDKDHDQHPGKGKGHAKGRGHKKND
jgi:hypothetical protein